MIGMDLFGLVSGFSAVISAAVAMLAVGYSRSAVRAARDQASAAIGANQFARQVGQSEAVIHFTGRFFDLMCDGPKFGDQAWEYQFWSLHAAEFYFFDNTWIPSFMYQLWMVELTSLYADDRVRESHNDYLQCYSGNYARMSSFFEELQGIGWRYKDPVSRNRKVADLVDGWTRIEAKTS